MTTADKVLEYLYQNETDAPTDLTDFLKGLDADESNRLTALLELKNKFAYINTFGEGECKMYFGKIKPEGKTYFLTIRANKKPATNELITEAETNINWDVVMFTLAMASIIVTIIAAVYG